jgi:hypothetical protein
MNIRASLAESKKFIQKDQTLWKYIQPMKILLVEAFIQELCFQESLASTFSTMPYTSDPLLCIGLAGLEDALDRDRSFLVHTETGRALSGTNLISNLRSYVTAVSGLKANLSNVTVMTLRASYESVMFRAFRRGRFPGQTAEQFLSELAEVLNSSPEMLRQSTLQPTRGNLMNPPVSFEGRRKLMSKGHHQLMPIVHYFDKKSLIFVSYHSFHNIRFQD